MGTPLANPIYLSDSPRFLQRQRLRASRAAVTEHVPSWTCPCQKCKSAAKTRAVPGFGIAVPGVKPVGEAWNPSGDIREATLIPAGFAAHGFDQVGQRQSSAPNFHPAVSSTKPAPRSNTLTSSTAPRIQGERRDFFWLLQAVQECCPAIDEPVKRVPAVGRIESVAETERRRYNESLLAKCGFKIPDIVILRNGKPKKRFSLDGSGKMQVEKLQSSAQLLRILRRYVQIAQKSRPLAPAFNPAPSRKGAVKTLHASQSEPILQKRQSPSEADAMQQRLSRRGAEPLREAAVLYYDDAAVRYMTTGEALKQMENVSRLPREFWQHIVMLQTPVQASMPDATTRYITYTFDASSSAEGFEPQAPLPLLHRRSHSTSNFDQNHGHEATLVAAVPRKINECLAAKKGRYGNGMTIISARFEFVFDEAEGTLWLINVEKLICEQQELCMEDCNSEDDEHRYFKEEEFKELMQEEQRKHDTLKERWDVQPCEQELPHEGDEPPVFQFTSKNAADRLSQKKSPEELEKYFDEREKMLRFYFSEIKSGGVLQARARDNAINKAVGLSVWFKRWVKSHRGSDRIGTASQSARQQPPSQGMRTMEGPRVRSAGPCRGPRK